MSILTPALGPPCEGEGGGIGSDKIGLKGCSSCDSCEGGGCTRDGMGDGNGDGDDDELDSCGSRPSALCFAHMCLLRPPLLRKCQGQWGQARVGGGEPSITTFRFRRFRLGNLMRVRLGCKAEKRRKCGINMQQ